MTTTPVSFSHAVSSSSSESSSSEETVISENINQLTNANFKENVLGNETGIVFIRCHVP